MIFRALDRLGRSRPVGWWCWLAIASFVAAILVGFALKNLPSDLATTSASVAAIVCLSGFLPAHSFTEAGRLIAGAGAAASVVLGELEFGSGPRYYAEGSDWLMVALLFAFLVMAMHLAREILDHQKTLRSRAAQAEERRLEALRHEELLATLRRIDDRPSQVRPSTAALLGASVVFVWMRAARRS